MKSLFEQFSSVENLKKAYGYIKHELNHATLSVDPFNHASVTAIDSLGDEFFIALEEYLISGKYTPEKGYFVYIPKDNLGLRPVCVLTTLDRIVYQAIFNPDILGNKLDGKLSSKLSFASRISNNTKNNAFLENYSSAWNEYLKEQKRQFKKGFSWRVELDIQQYFENIPIDKLLEVLRDCFNVKDEKLLDVLRLQLSRWSEYGLLEKGIPQGPLASALIGNVYLFALDKYFQTISDKNLVYLRYVDDIVLLGKTKEDVLKTVEKIVHFLRQYNLNINEKTKLVLLENTETIDAMRFGDYGDSEVDVPDDDLMVIGKEVPVTVEKILSGESVQKKSLSHLKYFLGVSFEYDLDLALNLTEVVMYYPSLTIPIIRYISNTRLQSDFLGDSLDTVLIDNALWEMYGRKHIAEWSRFWILKLLVSNKDVIGADIEDEVERIIDSKEKSLYKVISFYYKIIKGTPMNGLQVIDAIANCDTNIEKSLFSYFLISISDDELKDSFVKSHIEDMLNDVSFELNLVGYYLLKNRFKTLTSKFDGTFSSYLIKNKQADSEKDLIEPPMYFAVKQESLIPLSEVLNLKTMGLRPKKNKSSFGLSIPSPIDWTKLTIKFKEGMNDVEIWYDNNHVQNTDYIELGFSSNKKNHKPDRNWVFLTLISYLLSTDIKEATPLALSDMVAKYTRKATKVGTIHATKKNLSKKLKQLFNTNESPFMATREYTEPKFKLLSETLMRNPELWKQGGVLNDNFDHNN